MTERSPLHLAGTLGSPAGASRPARLPRGEAVRAQRARHARPQPAGSGTSPESRAGSGRQGRSSRGKLQRLQRHEADFSLRSAERPGIPRFRGKQAAVGRRNTRLPARCLGPCRGARAACCQAGGDEAGSATTPAGRKATEHPYGGDHISRTELICTKVSNPLPPPALIKTSVRPLAKAGFPHTAHRCCARELASVC